VLGGTIIGFLNLCPLTFDFGRQHGLLLAPSIAPLDVLAMAVLVVAVAVVASLQPAWKASRMAPVDALRHQ
jgi:putative ABC transport system permease protein